MDRNKNYTRFHAEDFLKDSYFLAWMQGKDGQANAFWEQWQIAHPDKQEIIKEAILRYEVLTSFDQISHLTEEDQEVWRRIEAGIGERLRKKIFRMRLLEWSAAAVVTLLLSAGWLLYKQTHLSREGFVIVQTGNGQKELLLSDSSEIFLDSYTSLKYHPDNDREYWLDGQAYFNIRHRATKEDPATPFILHAGVENITVLGTSFTAKSRDSVVLVVLIRGKIKAGVRGTSLILKPGEKLSWERGTFTSETVDTGLYTAWKEGEFHFNHTSLKDLATLIKDYYGYDLVVRNKAALKTKTISGTVSSKDEDVLLKTIALMFHARLHKEGKQIILTIDK